ncbi:hypothetical protein [Vibrio litoralis]|uniref:hypothetical protein n=1 Tax=Vibrio litoralis TaxID=335972 RepID=UPI0018676FB5|nr:hypothetical protein [Vibrio litoralis]
MLRSLMVRLFAISFSFMLAFSSHAAADERLSDSDVTRYFVCSYLHTEDSYKIGAYLIKNYEVQWYSHSETYKALVNDRLAEISRDQSVSKFKAEDELSTKYKCNSAYIDLIGLSNIKI